MRSIKLLTLGLLFCVSAAAVHAGSIVGKVSREGGTAVANCRVTVVELSRGVFTDASGNFEFQNIPAGHYHIQATSRGLGSSVREIDVGQGQLTVNLELNTDIHQESVVVTATRGGRGSAEVVQPVNVIDPAELSEKMQPTLGETLANEAGISSTFFGAGASRPVIRGQTGGRVRVLESGLGVGDASTTSPDHAVATDTFGADQIEILRGPSTLLYGSAAVGGVVNILDSRIPEFVPATPVGGELNLRYGSAAEEQSGAIKLHGGQGAFAWYAEALSRETDDYDIPGNAIVGDPTSPRDTLPNSSLESDGFTVGGSWVTDRGFWGVSARSFDTVYGIPAELEEEEELTSKDIVVKGIAPAEGIKIDMEQRRYDLRGEHRGEWGVVQSLRFNLGVTDYEHAELEGTEVGTSFFTETNEARLELAHGNGGNWSGIAGITYQDRELEAIGAEAFLPRVDSSGFALFALEEFQRGNLRYEVGARFETTDVETPATTAASGLCQDLRDNDFNTLSTSVGVAWLPNDSYTLGASLARAARAPGAEELLSCGPHVATSSFEVGDPTLDAETSLNLDLSVRRRKGRVTGELNLFTNRYDDFIYEFATGGTEDGLPVFQFTQDDAEFYGAELNALIELYHTDRHDLDFRVFGDVVRGELRATDEPLPRIPAQRLGVGVEYRGAGWHGALDIIDVDDQDRLAPTETVTDGYTMINARVGYRFVTGRLVHDVTLRGTNLSDEEARVHASRLKDLVPLPGADIGLIYRLVF